MEGICSRGPGGDPPGRLLLQAVRILLEWILVIHIILHSSNDFGFVIY